MEINLAELEVIHNPAENRLETWVAGQLATLDYMQEVNDVATTNVGV